MHNTLSDPHLLGTLSTNQFSINALTDSNSLAIYQRGCIHSGSSTAKRKRKKQIKQQRRWVGEIQYSRKLPNNARLSRDNQDIISRFVY